MTFMLYCLLLLHFHTVHKPMKWVFDKSPGDSLKRVQLAVEKNLQVSEVHGLELKPLL